MRAGLLREQITIEQRSTTPDAIGQPTESWSTVATVWANIRHISGLEAIKAGATTAVVKASIRIRYLDSLNAGMRVVHGTTVYQIESVLPAPPIHVDLVCEKVAQ